MEHHCLTDEFMCTYDDIYLTIGKVFEEFGGLFGGTGSCQIIHSDGHVLQTGGERAEVLIGQHGGRHQYGYLLTIRRCLEGCAHGHLRLAKTHIATDQTVHGFGLLHICFHILRGLQLVRGILIEETGLEFVLEIGVWTVRKTFFLTALSIEFDQVAGNIFDMFLGTLFQSLPLSCAKGGESGCLAIVLRLVFRHLI